MELNMQKIELSAGMIDYEDTGGNNPVVVLLHGFAMDGSVWRRVVQELRHDHRCLVPTLPLGSHQHPMREDADLSAHGIARLQAEFLQALDLREVTLVGNDSGIFQITAGLYPERIARLVLTPCESFENFPPGLPGRTAELGVKMPGGAFLMAQALRLHPLRRLPLTFGWMAKRPIPHEMIDAWVRPLQTRREIRRDLTKFMRTSNKGDMSAAAERLRRFDRPALVVWAPEDRINPPEYGRRWAELLPHGQLIEIADSYTLLPLDQPQELAHAIRQFIRDTP
jgi:pimeloyl-ACP methyl ester carboxylesterase